MARSYTRESGVRTLDRHIASIVRYVAAFTVMENEKSQGAANHRQLVTAKVAPSVFVVMLAMHINVNACHCSRRRPQ